METCPKCGAELQEGVEHACEAPVEETPVAAPEESAEEAPASEEKPEEPAA